MLNVQTGLALGSFADTTLPAQSTDLSLRFHHLETKQSLPGLVAAWPMDEGSGYEFRDISGNGHTAYITGINWNTTASGLTESFRKAGKRGGAVYLNGTQWLQVQKNESLDHGSMSVSFWINPAKIAVIKKTVLLSKKAEESGYTLYITDKGKLSMEIFHQNKTHSAYEAALVKLHEWSNISFVVDSIKKEVALYINGKQATRKKLDFTSKNIPADLFIGGTTNNGYNGFNGLIDELYYFNKALSASSLQSLYVNGLPKMYTQYRATIDTNKSVWTSFQGNQPIPHPKENGTKLLLRFNEILTSEEGIRPIANNQVLFVPGSFGGACKFIPASMALQYPSGLSAAEGSFEAWYIPDLFWGKQTLFTLFGKKGVSLQLYKERNSWITVLKSGNKIARMVVTSKEPDAGGLAHIALTWKPDILSLWINGVLKKELPVAVPVFDSAIELGGSGNEYFRGLLDDVCLSNTAKTWGAVCPSGFRETESAPLDFMDGFDGDKTGVFHWTTFSNTHAWQTGDDKTESGNPILMQKGPQGFQAITHPSAQGFSSSIEAGILLDAAKDGEVGLFTNAGHSSSRFTGIRFSINPEKNSLQLAVYKNGNATAQKKAAYPFPIKTSKRYTLTLSVYEGVARGFVDGNNLVALKFTETLESGYAGLFTDNSTAAFDDVHFSALTPATDSSRLLQVRIISDSSKEGERLALVNHSFNAFRWKKRYGLLPWQRTYKKPEPPGNIFGPNDVVRPNATQSWRSEDAANSDIISVDGMMYYCLRGNPDHGGPHGVSGLGMLAVNQQQYDGLHFKDLNADSLGSNGIGLLHGHRDNGGLCADAPPRDKQFQVNDEGMVYVDGKILVIAREFRNRQHGYPPFRRLVFGLFDIATRKWIAHEPYTVTWSAMSSDSCFARFTGINATPEICSLIDAETGKPVIFLFHNESRNSMAIGLYFDGKDLNFHPGYPSKKLFSKRDKDALYGQRVLFDNGIYYMHVNAGSDSTKLRKDWPDRFQLFTALDPYKNTWTESAENSNKQRPYFTRGEEADPDNAAIWQGTMFKYRNRYYMYYENYHSIDNRDNAYDLYDEAHSGSRVGYATAN